MDQTSGYWFVELKAIVKGLHPGSTLLVILPREQVHRYLESLSESMPYGCELTVLFENDQTVSVKITRNSVLIWILPGGILIDYTV